MSHPELSISVVSHAQCHWVADLLDDISKYYPRNSLLEVILTLNLGEALPFNPVGFAFKIKVIQNAVPMGFSANHNQAFQQSSGKFFCVINPDIRLNHDPFPALITCLHDSSIAVVAPLVVNERGLIEDSARRFPTPFKILCKAIGGCKGSDYFVKDEVIFPDWVGGMFMLFRREAFEQSCGFDQRYFLYYEDVDLCARLRLQGLQVALCPDAKVVHHAHRSSHRSLKYLRWHLSSMLRFFTSSPFLNICWIRLKK